MPDSGARQSSIPEAPPGASGVEAVPREPSAGVDVKPVPQQPAAGVETAPGNLSVRFDERRAGELEAGSPRRGVSRSPAAGGRPTGAPATSGDGDAPPADIRADAPEVSPLVPEGEAAKMAPRRVADHVVFVPGKGLQVMSADGDFSLETKARLQFMGKSKWLDGRAPALSLLVRRARVMFGGHVFDPATHYKIELGFSPSDMGIGNNVTGTGPAMSPLMDFFFDFTQLRDLSVRVGQGKVPFSRQFVLSAGSLQLADLSLATNEFNLNRDAGVQIHSQDFLGLDLFRYALGVYSGRGRDAVGSMDTSLMYIGRAEVLPFGMFDDYSEADFERTMHPRLSVGVAYAFIDRAKWDRGTFGAQPADLGTTDMHSVVVDSMFKLAGFSFLGEYFWRQGYRNVGPNAPAVPARNGWGLTTQAGYLIPHLPFEIAGRYSGAHGRGATSLADSNELGGGLSWYFARHALKIQGDYFRLWGGNLPGISPRFDHGGHRVRIQLTADL